MVVQHNLTAMNSNRLLGLTTSSQAKSTERLSSGYKINRAADDAAGLSISEKMRKQVRGLTQASANAEDGISAVQTAEGALNEVQDMLQRMNELAVKASNGTMSENDRSYVQNEVSQLTTEIDRVAETTKFNETYLLKGDKSAEKEYSFAYGTVAAKAATVTLGTSSTATAGSATIALSAPTSQEMADAQNELANVLKDKGINFATTDADTTAVTATTIEGFTVANDGKVTKAGVTGTLAQLTIATGTADGTSTQKATAVTAGNAEGPQQFYDKDGNKIAANALNNYLSTADGTTTTVVSGKKLYDATGNDVTADFDDGTITATQDKIAALELKLHVGADATDNNQIKLEIDAMSSSGLGVAGLQVDGPDDTNARNAIDTIKEAIQKVSTQRSALGAAQNRLEHTINNLDNVVENTTSAESQIRDTDMATEMVKYSNNNILSQAGQAMLAQANQSNQGVLSLLQ